MFDESALDRHKDEIIETVAFSKAWSLGLGMLDIKGRFCVYLYPHSHSKPEILSPLCDKGRHL